MLIAQISDMHVSKPGKLFGNRIESRVAFERCVTRVLALDPKPDLVLLSGDLAESGAPEEYDFIAGQLARLQCPVLAIPGNHDVREEMLRKLPGSVTQQKSGHLNFADDRLPLRIIGLDTTIPDAVPGELCAERIAWLRETLANGNKKPCLIAMHHPPFQTGISVMDGYGIKSGLAEFREIIAEHAKKISAIVCGHAHRMMVSSIHGVPVLLSPASSFPFHLDLRQQCALHFIEEPQQFLLHAWSEASGLVSHAVFVDAFPGPHPLR